VLMRRRSHTKSFEPDDHSAAATAARRASARKRSNA
jgi:hypothetical protein